MICFIRYLQDGYWIEKVAAIANTHRLIEFQILQLSIFGVVIIKKEQFEKGVSLLIANNEHGHNLLVKTSNLQLNPSTIKEAINSNPNLYDGFKFIQYHPLVLFPDFFQKSIYLENCGYV